MTCLWGCQTGGCCELENRGGLVRFGARRGRAIPPMAPPWGNIRSSSSSDFKHAPPGDDVPKDGRAQSDLL